jgi:hypothetical protein
LDVLIVKPGKEEIKRNQVAIWEPDDPDGAHAKADPAWELLGGAFVAGDSANPDKTYRVADTAAVRDAIRKERLVLVEEVAEAASGTEKSPETLLVGGADIKIPVDGDGVVEVLGNGLPSEESTPPAASNEDMPDEPPEDVATDQPPAEPRRPRRSH